MNIAQRQKGIAIITILVISLCVVYLLAIEPLYKKYAVLNQEIRSKQSRLAENLRLLKEKEAIQEEFKKYNYLLKVKGSKEEEMASVLAEIEGIGKNTGLYLNDIKPQRGRDLGFCQIMLVEVRFQANMQTLSKFIYELQNSVFLLKASKLQITSQRADSRLLEGVIQISRTSIL
ncbi:type 4a pilus biogenesis protein PilO [Candidatus Omnitrophota bacterium]